MAQSFVGSYWPKQLIGPYLDKKEDIENIAWYIPETSRKSFYIGIDDDDDAKSKSWKHVIILRVY